MCTRNSLLLAMSLVLSPLFNGCAVIDRSVAPESGKEWVPCGSAPRYKSSSDVLIGRGKAGLLIGKTQLDLPMLMDIAFENSPDTRKAWEIAKVAAAKQGEANSAFFPKVGISYTFDRSVAWSNTKAQDSYVLNKISGHGNYPTLELAMSIFKFGAHVNSANAAKQALYAANYQYNRSLQTLMYQIQISYFNLVSAKSMVLASEKNLEDARCSCESAEIQFKSGLGSMQDLLQSRAGFSQAQFDMEKSLADVESARANLAKIMGVKVGSNIEIYESADYDISDNFVADIDNLIDDSLKTRPDILSAYSELLSKQASANQTKGEFLPELIVGFAGNSKKYTGHSGRSEDYQAYVRLEWQIFNGFYDTYRILEAKAAKEKARQELRSIEISAAADIWTKYHSFKSSIKQYEAAQNLLKASQESFDAMNIAYKNGLSKFNDLLATQSQLSKARTSFVSAKNHFFSSIVELSYATGGLISAPNNTFNR